MLKKLPGGGDIAAIEADIEKLKANLAAAEAAHVATVAFIENPPLDADDDAEIERIARDETIARVKLSQARSRLAARDAELADARQRKAIEQQHELEKAADKAAGEAATLMATNLTEMARLTRQMLRAVAEADLQVQAANKSRSSELEPIPGVEARARVRPPQPKKIVRDDVVKLWTDDDTSEPVSPELQAQVRPGRKDAGSIFTAGGHRHQVTLRRFRKITSVPAAASVAIMPLARELAIPGLHAGDPPAWSPIDIASPDGVLRRLDALAAATQTEREPLVELVPIDGDEPDARAVGAA